LLARVGSFAVCAALRRYGLFDLHSAGVVEPESDSAVLIVGPSGSGKSTLALQLVNSGGRISLMMSCC
jgi:ABC-type polar amino acid transport system ATPase subunit